MRRKGDGGVCCIDVFFHFPMGNRNRYLSLAKSVSPGMRYADGVRIEPEDSSKIRIPEKVVVSLKGWMELGWMRWAICLFFSLFFFFSSSSSF